MIITEYLLKNRLVLVEALVVINAYGFMINEHVLGVDSGIPIPQLNFIVMVIGGLLISKNNIAFLGKRWLPLLIFGVLSLLGVIFSIDPLLAARRFIAFVGVLVFSIGLSAPLNADEFRESFKRLAILLVPFVVISLSGSGNEELYDYQDAYLGYSGSRYWTSFMFAIVASISIVNVGLHFGGTRGNRRYAAFGIAMLSGLSFIASIYIIFSSIGRVGVLLLSIALTCYLIVSLLSIQHRLLFVLSGFLLMGAAYYWSEFLIDYARYSIDRGLSGRDLGTGYLLEAVYENPHAWILGFGGGSIDLHYEMSQLELRDSGNIPTILFEYGVVGLGCFFWFFISTLRKCFANITGGRFDLGFYAGLFIFLVITPASSPAINFLYLEGILMFVSAAVMIGAYRGRAGNVVPRNPTQYLRGPQCIK